LRKHQLPEVGVLDITILDHNFDRLNACEVSVKTALKDLGMKAIVTKVSEPPFLSRLNVWEKLPALQIDGLIWSRKSKEAFTANEVLQLLKNNYKDKQKQVEGEE
jgi:hypothetical protein